MKYLAAYLLFKLGDNGNDDPSKIILLRALIWFLIGVDDLKKIFDAVDIKADEAILTKVVDLCKGKSIHDVIKDGLALT